MAPKIQFDLSSLNRRQLPLLIGAVAVIIIAIIGLLLILTKDQSEPDNETVTENTVTTSTPSPTPSVMPTATPTTDNLEQTLAPAATPTLEPYTYTVQAGDTLYYILGLFGYRELSIVPEVLALNGMASENDLFADQTLLIPRQTPTPGPTTTPSPTPGEGTPTIDPNLTPDYSDCSPENRCISPDGQYWLHTVQEGETCAQVAVIYDTTVPDVLRDNNLTNDCIIQPNQVLRVFIRVTLTPTLTPTGGPNSTATPTPTLMPPDLLSPADGASVARNERVVLQWVTTQSLDGDQHYLVVVTNTTTGNEYRWTTRSNVYRLPDDLRPGSGQSIVYQWRVVIVAGKSTESVVVSGQDSGQTFTWGG